MFHIQWEHKKFGIRSFLPGFFSISDKKSSKTYAFRLETAKMDFQWITTISWEYLSQCVSSYASISSLLELVLTCCLFIDNPASTAFPPSSSSSVPSVFLWVLLPLKHLYTFSHFSLSHTHTRLHKTKRGAAFSYIFQKMNMLRYSCFPDSFQRVTKHIKGIIII